MSLPIEIQTIVDKCEAAGYSGAVIALFDTEYELETSGSDWDAARDFTKEILAEFDHEIMDEDGGYEGGGEYCYSVIRLGDKFFKAEWNYYSYDGCDFDYIEDTITEVTPSQKTVTVYE